MRKLLLCVLPLLFPALTCAAERTPSPPGAQLEIITPADGAVVTSPVRVQFGLRGMGVAPAGIKFDDTGHHHVLIDTDPPADLSKPLPATDRILHFGKGQTEAEIVLPPGKHTLQLVLGDYLHIPHDPPVMSPRITITVKDGAAKGTAEKTGTKESTGERAKS